MTHKEEVLTKVKDLTKQISDLGKIYLPSQYSKSVVNINLAIILEEFEIKGKYA